MKREKQKKKRKKRSLALRELLSKQYTAYRDRRDENGKQSNSSPAITSLRACGGNGRIKCRFYGVACFAIIRKHSSTSCFFFQILETLCPCDSSYLVNLQIWQWFEDDKIRNNLEKLILEKKLRSCRRILQDVLHVNWYFIIQLIYFPRYPLDSFAVAYKIT